jgi:uncharacterized protein (TIGR02145 family)
MKTMKNILTIIMLCGVMSGYAQNTPPHAASKKTWIVGKQIWSDAIRHPDCKHIDSKSDYDPGCYIYNNGFPYYYYNLRWAHGGKLCPSPWRVPTERDFKILYDTLRKNNRNIAADVREWVDKSYGNYI